MISISMAFFADTDLARHCLWVLDRPVGFVRRLGPCRTDAAVANAWRGSRGVVESLRSTPASAGPRRSAFLRLRPVIKTLWRVSHWKQSVVAE
jgi:hypothetical protein